MILHHLASALFAVLFGPFLLDVHSSSKEEVKVSSLDADQDLVAVFSVLRHGDRAPTDFYPLDPFSNASYWAPNGIGELNPLGIERMRESGRLYRERYRAFLDRVGGWPAYVRSSTRNRTIESAKYFLESFLADEGSSASASRVRANLSSMITLDQRMLTTSYPCNRSNAAWLQWFQSAEVTGYMRSKHGDIEHLGRLTGEDYFAAAPFTLRQLEFLATTTSIERDEYGLDVPSWIRNRSNIALMDDFKRHAYLFDWRPPVVQKYRVGPLLGDIRDNAEVLISKDSSKNSSQNNSSSQSFFLYSTHDVNQVLLLQALGLYEQIGQWPTTYSAAIVFEVFRRPGDDNGSNKPLIRTLYRQVNRTAASFWASTYALVDQPLNLTSCANSLVEVEIIGGGGDGKDGKTSSSTVELLCPFEEFKRLIAEKVPLHYEAECSSTSSAGAVVNSTFKVAGVVLLFTVLLNAFVLL
ncbi:hypothetical protein TYRP_003774 [Tyrophagus putrescentiae]|nr:hypothetical protein TYRP_003774 [Tyrophagus putrescentiae]